MTQHPRYRPLLEPARVVAGEEHQLGSGLGEQRQRVAAAVDEGGARDAQRALPGGGVRPRVHGGGVVLEDEDAVEERGATWDLAPALHLDEVAVLVLPQRGELVLERPQPRHERRPPWDLHPHGQRIDE